MLRFWLMIGLLVLLVVPTEAAVVKQLSDCESTSGWSSGAQLSADAYQGNTSVATDLPAGKTHFFTLNYQQTGIDLSKTYALSFWWRVEGAGLTDLKIKVVNHPLVDGFQAVYQIWNSSDTGPYPSTWQRATLILSETDYIWGNSPNLNARQMTFRTETDSGAQVRFFVDHVVAIPKTFSLTLGTPHAEARPVSGALDFDSDGTINFTDFVMFAQHFGTTQGDSLYDAKFDLDVNGNIALSDFIIFAAGYGRSGIWFVPTTVTNETDDALTFVFGSGDVRVDTVSVSASGSGTFDVGIPGAFKSYDSLDPLENMGFAVWAQVIDEPDTRLSSTTAIRRPMDLPEHPRLLFNEAGIAELNARIAHYPWAKAQWESILKKADQLLRKAVTLPPRGGNWWHYYASPSTGATLKRGNQIGTWQWEHIDPVTGEVFLGDPSVPSRDYDGVVINGIHDGWATDLRNLGVVYQVTGDARYAAKGREILMAYAEKYLQYELHNTRGEPNVGGGRVGAQTLDEAVWLIRMCQGADLIWETLSESDKQAVADQLMQPAAREVILPHKLGVHNIQCWKNSAVGLVGFLLNDQELIWEAIENPERGYRKQMRDGVMPDGMWWEGAWGYHFYTLSALWNLTEAAHNSGLDLYGDALKRMYDVPIVLAMPNMHLPAFNDSKELDLKSRASYYEIAYARYGNPDYLPILATSNRENNNALWFGTGDARASSGRKWESINYPQSGYAILANGRNENATWLCLDYAPHGGGHGHPDKLGFVLYSQGETLGFDPGSTKYGLPSNAGWFKTSLAHNTLVVDETSQAPSEGTCLAFGTVSGVDYVMADAGPIYDDLAFRRTVSMMDEDLIVFVDQVQAKYVHTLDIAYHHRGEWANNLTNGSAWTVPEKDGYSYLRDAQKARSNTGQTLGVRTRSYWNPSTIVLASGDMTEIITATGVGAHEEDRVPAVIFRRQSRDTAFGWGVSISGKAVTLQRLDVKDAVGQTVAPGQATAFWIAPENGPNRAVVVNPEGMNISVLLIGGSTWETNAIYDVRDF